MAYQEYRINEDATRALQPGTNFLAVHCRQDFGAQYIDVALIARGTVPGGESLVLASASDPEMEANTTAAGRDWPQFLGPSRNAVCKGPSLREDWPSGGLPLLWSAPIGEGYSSPVVGEGKAVLCHRLGDQLVVDCFEPLTGAVQWSFRDPMKFSDGAHYDSGPRPTPAIRNGRVFVFNTDGHLTCLKLTDGSVLWSHRCRSELGGRGTWSGFVASPLVLSNAVIVALGGMRAAVVAFAPDTGALLWQQHDDEATAASPLVATLAGHPQLLVITRTFLRGLDPETGEGLWQYATHRQGSGSVFGASPVVLGDYIFLSGWYGLGARLLRIGAEGPERIWSRNDALSTLYANAIVHRGHVYGFHGHPFEGGGPALRCIDLETGQVQWEQRGAAAGTLIRCGEQLLILFDSGELQLVAADPARYKVKATTQLFGRYTRSYPAIVDGLVYVRGPKKLVCVDLRRRK